MKKNVRICALLICVASLLASAAGDDNLTLLINQGWGSGQSFLSLTKGEQASTAAGIVSGLFMSPLMGAPERGSEIVALSECTKGMTTGQLAAIVEKYLRDHPANWNAAIAISMVVSLQGVCPKFDEAVRNSPTGPEAIKALKP